MKKQLLITTLAAFSGLAFAETPLNHAEVLNNLVLGWETTGQNCPKAQKKLSTAKALLTAAQERLEETGAFNWTDEERAYIEKMYAKYNQHHNELTIEDLAGKTTEAPRIDLSEAVGTEKAE